MTFKELEYIWAIADEKNITKAAKKLNISQPAISRCLLKLEKELEISLFEKIEGNYVPTSAGNLYLQFAKDVLARKVQFDSDFRELLQYRQGRLRFGITPGRSKSLTPDVLPKIRKHFPDIKIVKERIEGGANEKAVWRLFINCPFVCINFDFFWLNKVRQLYMDF